MIVNTTVKIEVKGDENENNCQLTLDLNSTVEEVMVSLEMARRQLISLMEVHFKDVLATEEEFLERYKQLKIKDLYAPEKE